MMRHALSQKEFPAAIGYADDLLRAYPDIVDPFVGPLVRIAEDKQARALLFAVLAENPPWRQSFVTGMSRAVTDARTPFEMLLALKQSPNPPTQTR